MFRFLILCVIVTEATINPKGPTIVNDYANCLIQLMDAEFNKSGLLVFANSKKVSTSVIRIRSELLKYIHSSVQYSVQIATPSKEGAICGENDRYDILQDFDDFEPIPLADYFVIIVDTYSEFTYLASKLIQSRNWNPQAKFIILIQNFATSDEENVKYTENIMTCMFRYNVINIVVIVPQQNNVRNALIYGWRPYDPPEYCGYDNETAKNRLIKENVCEKGALKNKTEVFGERLPSDMKGCTLIVLALERKPFVSADISDSNMERELINEVLSTINFKPKYELLTVYRGERDSEWNGALHELLSRRGNILIGGIFPDNDVHEDFDCSSTYLGDFYTWVVPRSYPEPKWRALIIIFSTKVWVLVIISFIVGGFVWRILGQLSQDTVRNKTLLHCFLSTWICTLGFCTFLRPKREALRVFFVFFNLYCIMCLTAYQTKLIDVLRNPAYEHQIDTVEELVTSELKFGGFEEFHDLFANSTDPFDYQLGKKWTDIDNLSQAMIDVAVHRNFSLFCSRLELEHISATQPELRDGFGYLKYYAFKTDMFAVPLEMVMMKGFPFMKEFSKILADIKQIGVNARVRRIFASLNMRRKAKMIMTINSSRPDIVALSLQHLQGGFLALMFGYIFGTVVFVVEMALNNNYVKNKIYECRQSFKKE